MLARYKLECFLIGLIALCFINAYHVFGSLREIHSQTHEIHSQSHINYKKYVMDTASEATPNIVTLAHKNMSVALVTFEISGLRNSGGIGSYTTEMCALLTEAGASVTIVFFHWQSSMYDEVLQLRNRRKGDCFGSNKTTLALVPIQEEVEVASRYSWHASSGLSIMHWMIHHADSLDIVHFPDNTGVSFWTSSAQEVGMLSPRLQIITVLHGTTIWATDPLEWPDPKEAMKANLFESRAIENSPHVVSPSNYMSRYIKSRVKQQIEPFIIPNPLRWKHQANKNLTTEKCLGVRIEELAFFGRLEARKGLYLMLEALNILHSQKPLPPYLRSLKIRFLGRPTRTVEARSTVKYIQEQIHLHSNTWGQNCSIDTKKDRDSAIKMLEESGRCSRLVIIPSLVENYPYTVVEATNSKLRFIASNVGGIPEILSKDVRSKYLFLPDPASLSDKIESVLKNYSSEALPIDPLKSSIEIGKMWLKFHETLFTAKRSPEMRPTRIARAPLKIWIILRVGIHANIKDIHTSVESITNAYGFQEFVEGVVIFSRRDISEELQNLTVPSFVRKFEDQLSVHEIIPSTAPVLLTSSPGILTCHSLMYFTRSISISSPSSKSMQVVVAASSSSSSSISSFSSPERSQCLVHVSSQCQITQNLQDFEFLRGWNPIPVPRDSCVDINKSDKENSSSSFFRQRLNSCNINTSWISNEAPSLSMNFHFGPSTIFAVLNPDILAPSTILLREGLNTLSNTYDQGDVINFADRNFMNDFMLKVTEKAKSRIAFIPEVLSFEIIQRPSSPGNRFIQNRKTLNLLSTRSENLHSIISFAYSISSLSKRMLQRHTGLVENLLTDSSEDFSAIQGRNGWRVEFLRAEGDDHYPLDSYFDHSLQAWRPIIGNSTNAMISSLEIVSDTSEESIVISTRRFISAYSGLVTMELDIHPPGGSPCGLRGGKQERSNLRVGLFVDGEELLSVDVLQGENFKPEVYRRQKVNLDIGSLCDVSVVPSLTSAERSVGLGSRDHCVNHRGIQIKLRILAPRQEM